MPQIQGNLAKLPLARDTNSNNKDVNERQRHKSSFILPIWDFNKEMKAVKGN